MKRSNRQGFVGAAAAIAVLSCTASRPQPPESSQPRTRDAVEPATTEVPATEIAIEDVACEPKVPDWERVLALGYAWSQLHAADFAGERGGRMQASTLVDRLPTDDPRYVEAHCRAGFAHYNMMHVGVADRHFRRAIAEQRRRSVTDAEQRYATAARSAFAIDVLFAFDGSKGQHRISVHTTGISLDPDDCRTPDVALLELARANLYRSANRTQIREVAKQKRGKLGTLAADTGAALQDEIEGALGPRHRLSIGMREHMVGMCEEKQELRFPQRCPKLLDLLERNFADRSEVLGEQHTDTRRSALLLGGERLAAGRTADAKKLFELAATGEPDETWIAAQQQLAGLEFDDGKQREGFARLQRVAEVLPTSTLDEWREQQAWRLFEEAAQHTGHTGEAERARTELERMKNASYYVGPGGPSLGMIAMSLEEVAAPLHETAVSGVVEARTRELRRRDLRPEARVWRIAELDVALQCRALLRHRNGDDAGAAEDLRALAALRPRRSRG